ncbi:MAG: hypothetical protein DMG41_20500 [Acidobacteria bacterium]|nr:MAG: hypothetical protein AUH13_31000 [Acidobacteria bacterium 13_2_20CM_58_27]PYT86255.1 MAG: hypothetical protein DMG41_20500 [Acidobacteriota bacterium]
MTWSGGSRKPNSHQTPGALVGILLAKPARFALECLNLRKRLSDAGVVSVAPGQRQGSEDVQPANGPIAVIRSRGF